MEKTSEPIKQRTEDTDKTLYRVCIERVKIEHTKSVIREDTDTRL